MISKKHLKLDLVVLVSKEVVKGFIEYLRQLAVGTSFIAKLTEASNAFIIMNVDLYSNLVSK